MCPSPFYFFFLDVYAVLASSLLSVPSLILFFSLHSRKGQVTQAHEKDN